ncbi:MAG: hypothetical protein RLZZ67_154 [Candidatus Parcubacteria bacterium]|jgi:hypothetical protein
MHIALTSVRGLGQKLAALRDRLGFTITRDGKVIRLRDVRPWGVITCIIHGLAGIFGWEGRPRR